MAGETDLDALLQTLKPALVDGVFVFATVDAVPDGLVPRMVFREAEGVTLILLREEAETLGLPYEFPSRMITLDVHSSLEAVGFMARISTALAAKNMGVNPVAGFYHDHLFVPENRADDAMDVLHNIAAGRA
ncbi:hypothetical protein BCF46_1189 [Litoreibacter meonggei]|uniref:DUF2241 domain-containing protein n=1 Tax=Litoreibacter meonggei TaxID=1049199 RepID=A0A497WTM9_9RHOB|nr:ACT domain-containing protein [Litoreibacter meonggei]RLJ59047.1 hypothetical protein BCF46_1189 [Litoreibacter meonggei]